MNIEFIAAVMIPNLSMLRYHEEVGFYNTAFTEVQIFELKNKFEKNELIFNRGHNQNEIVEMKVLDSFILSDENRAKYPEGIQNLSNGSWILHFIVPKEYENFKGGFSIESNFILEVKGKTYKIREKFERMNCISELLGVNLFIYGGDKSSTGMNEHGDAHFTVQTKRSNTKMGKIYLPEIEAWKLKTKKEKYKFIQMVDIKKGARDITDREREAIALWLDLNDGANLIDSIKQWNISNRDNPRAKQMYLPV